MVKVNRRKEIKFYLLKKLKAAIYYFLLLYTKTLRFQIENIQVVLDHMRDRGPVILAYWHQRIFCGFFVPHKFNLIIPVMISRNRDGDLVAGVVERSGFIPVRGSSSRGGKEALREMVEAIKKYGVGAHTVDGPTGPPRVVKAGLIAMAQRTGAVICPTYPIYEKHWTFNSWDRFMVPKPFSRVLIHFSEDLEAVPAYLVGPEFETVRKKIEDRMIQKYEELDRYFTNPR